mgnify:CR=1 FL=1|tara:strand:+ start:1337 stop:1684 length:348 start_codon:yes stop_codon:yes gene_type:complete
MKKIFSLLSLLFLLNGCVEAMALLGPATTVVGGGNVAQSAITTVVNHGVKKQTGKSPTEHIAAYIKENNPDNKKENCVSFFKTMNSEACTVVNKKYADIKEKIKKSSKVINLNSN